MCYEKTMFDLASMENMKLGEAWFCVSSSVEYKKCSLWCSFFSDSMDKLHFNKFLYDLVIYSLFNSSHLKTILLCFFMMYNTR